jgi:hypothetical protein
MIDDTVNSSWKRFTDRVKAAWSDHSDIRASEPMKAPTPTKHRRACSSILEA